MAQAHGPLRNFVAPPSPPHAAIASGGDDATALAVAGFGVGGSVSRGRAAGMRHGTIGPRFENAAAAETG
jgi:hypothetical protein